MKSAERWQYALQASYPVAMGYIPAGIAFGVLFVAAKLPAWAAVFASVVLYAGAAQYAAISLLATGTGFATLASTTLAINLRHVFYAIPLLPNLPSSMLARYYGLFALTDETFSVLTTLDQEKRQALLLPISFLNQAYWIIGTVLGVLIGAKLNNLVPHLDFALVCLFAILAYEQYRKLKASYPIYIAVIALVVGLLWFQKWLLLSAIALSIVLIMGRFYLIQQRTHKADAPHD